MTPVGEIRLALPVAILGYKLPIWEAFFWGVMGNMVPVTIILSFAKYFHLWIHKRSGWFASAWVKYLDRAQHKFAGDYQKYGLIGLMIFVGIPLPMTGAWTGALAAFVFALPFGKSWFSILAGVIISGMATLLITVGAGRIF
ncbi:MAG: small multi-drug export protein [Candidatus Magasanikbacteria bacterium]|nr:small multi-drug export protein [Candidatus Magasanikbacteria bacterium]